MMATRASSSTSVPVCGCPSSVTTTSETIHSTQCPVCLAKFDPDVKLPIGLRCGHTLCKRCVGKLYPDIYPNGYVILDGTHGLPNLALLAHMDFGVSSVMSFGLNGQGAAGYLSSLESCEPDCGASIWRLTDIAVLLKGRTVSRAIQRKVLTLLSSLSPLGQGRVCRAARAVGERALVELTSSCCHLSHYHAQQQLWGAIRARACQFMGPAMQEEALKLVLLALEDGIALSRKVLVMFVVQRLAPQFPQASKTSIGHVIQLLYRASCFDVTKRQDASSLMTLRPEFRNYEALRREHDSQIVRIALESGISRFSPEQWSSILYGDTSHKPHMQSIIDKLQAPQSFAQMTTEFLVSIQRLSDTEDASFLLQLHPHFQILSTMELNFDSPPPSWTYTRQILDAVHFVLIGLVSFNPKPHFRNNSSRHNSHTNAHSQAPQSSAVTTTANSSNTRLVNNSGNYSRGNGGSDVEANLSSPNSEPSTSPIGSSEVTVSVSPTSDPKINQLLHESQMLREKMKLIQLQTKIPESEASKLSHEVMVLEEEATEMMQNVGIRS